MISTRVAIDQSHETATTPRQRISEVDLDRITTGITRLAASSSP